MTDLRSPYPWQGGKSRAADVIWRGLGQDIVNYVEPFYGSGAVLLGRPGGPGKIETVNDLDGAICNFWRAVKAEPDAVAEWCDDPVSELDLHARHAWLVGRLEEMAEQLRADPEYYDAKVAGWWVWGICQWIGTGWCGGIKHGEPRPNLNGGQGVHAPGGGTRELPHQRPHVSGDNAGMGIFSPTARPSRAAAARSEIAADISARMRTVAGRGDTRERRARLSQKMPNVSGFEGGVRARGTQKRQLPKLSVQDGASAVGGVLAPTLGLHHQIPLLAGAGMGINAGGLPAPPCIEWFRALQARLRRVRVVCGDWTRVLGPSVLGKGKNVGGRRPCGVILDPPYDVNMRARRIYNHDAPGLAAAVREWALEHGDDPDLRIVLCGYFEEHAEHMPKTWTVHRWKGARGYASEENDNRERETLWFSPHCLPIEQQRSLFGGAA